MIIPSNYRFKRCIAAETASLVGAGISAVGSIGSAAASGISASNLNRKNREWQEQQAALQRSWNEEMWTKQNVWNFEQWNRENLYNSPLAQKQRLMEAGLNPMYFGIDGVPAASLESAQPLGYERAESNPQLNPVGEALSSFAQMKGLENATKLANAQIDKLKEAVSAAIQRLNL